jgi:predicted phosphodiesterase
MMKKITFISDTHTKHRMIKLKGGDILIHAGDISSMGYAHEVRDFCEWFNNQYQYDYKIFIAGNHDWGFQTKSIEFKDIVSEYKNIIYLQDNYIDIGDFPDDQIRIYGSPWQPEFCNWAFNLPRNSQELKDKWDNIPTDIDILITHGPAFGHLDRVIGMNDNLGCELLEKRIKLVKPRIHVCGHIHSGRGYKFDGDTNYINASVLDERYNFSFEPIDIEWDKENNIIYFK